MSAARPGEAIDHGPLIREINFVPFKMRVATDRYYSPEYHERERQRLWMRVWQVACRADDIPEAGDWQVYSIFDQTYVVVRGKDGAVRCFVNACRHRGNAFCEGKGHSARFTCPYHNWSYGLDGACLSVAKPDYDGALEEFVGCGKEELGLVQVPAECFGGFVFINPDRQAEPLREFLGEIVDLLEPYRLDEMIPVGLNVREAVDCNWKVVMDAFQEGYHVQAVHPELVKAMDESKERYGFFGDHSVATGPFGDANMDDFGPAKQVESVHYLPATFPGVATVLPRFDELVGEHRQADGTLDFPEGINGRLLLQRATRDTLTARGLDVSRLTDIQMSDNHFHLVFPNLFMTIRAGECTMISSVPHPEGDPNRCIWHVMNLMWVPPEDRTAMREPLNEIAEGDHFPYFLALEQDYVQMARQQLGLRNSALKEMALTRQEVRLAHYHSALDGWVDSGETRTP